jgi:hypothetical protein
VTYKEPWSAARAVRKNGEVLGGVLMVGVKLVNEDNNSTWNSSNSSTGQTTTTGHMPSSSMSTPTSKLPLSNVGKPIHLLGPESAFKPTPPRRSFMSSTTSTTAGGVGGKDPQKSLFAERNRVAVQGEGEKGALGRISGVVFGW